MILEKYSLSHLILLLEADSSLAYSFTHHVEKQIGIEGNRVRELQGVLLQEGIMWAAPEESTHLGREDFQAEGTSAKTLDECTLGRIFAWRWVWLQWSQWEKKWDIETWDNGGWIGYCLVDYLNTPLWGIVCFGEWLEKPSEVWAKAWHGMTWVLK